MQADFSPFNAEKAALQGSASSAEDESTHQAAYAGEPAGDEGSGGGAGAGTTHDADFAFALQMQQEVCAAILHHEDILKQKEGE